VHQVHKKRGRPASAFLAAGARGLAGGTVAARDLLLFRDLPGVGRDGRGWPDPQARARRPTPIYWSHHERAWPIAAEEDDDVVWLAGRLLDMRKAGWSAAQLLYWIGGQK